MNVIDDVFDARPLVSEMPRLISRNAFYINVVNPGKDRSYTSHDETIAQLFKKCIPSFKVFISKVELRLLTKQDAEYVF